VLLSCGAASFNTCVGQSLISALLMRRSIEIYTSAVSSWPVKPICWLKLIITILIVVTTRVIKQLVLDQVVLDWQRSNSAIYERLPAATIVSVYIYIYIYIYIQREARVRRNLICGSAVLIHPAGRDNYPKKNINKGILSDYGPTTRPGTGLKARHGTWIGRQVWPL
jgi:hypothetical protein